jgi:hypothetical protein
MDVTIANQSGMLTGTTTASYVKVLTIDTRGSGIIGKTRFLLKNTGSSNSIYYKIDGYLSDPTASVGNAIALKAETSIAASGSVDESVTPVAVVLPWAAVVFSLKNNAGASTWSLEWQSY